MIFDTHIHLGSNLPITRTIPDLPSLKEIMSEQDIHKAVVIPTSPSIKDNQWMLEEVEGEPNLYPFLWYGGDSLDFIASQPHFSGLKYHPSMSQRCLDYSLIFHAKALLLCYERKIPLLVHCGRSPLSDASYVFEAARIHPDVNFIMAHFGGMVVDKIEKTIELYDHYGKPRNVYFDLANGRHPWLLKDFVNRYGSTHILFGSDLPFVDYELSVMNVWRAKLSTADSENILWKNAERLIAS